jgi:hypothetical protein
MTIRLQTGASSYFSKPIIILDPNLFEDNETIRPDVRNQILEAFYGYMDYRYNNSRQWTMVWLAGSGISFQWSANRGNGDLDVLFGIDYSRFVTDNPTYQFMDRHEIANEITDDLRRNLWPRTAHTYIGLGEYEVTYFLNENVEANHNSIVHIHPYAAYNLTKNEWTVKPPILPDTPAELYPHEYYVQAEANRQAAEALVSRYNALQQQGSMTAPNTPHAVNQSRSRALVVAEAQNLFDQLHTGRRRAFDMHGEGYGDFYNFQWQKAKEDGIINALNEIINREN